MEIDRHTVEQLLATYSWAMDGREFELLRGVFTADATFAGTIAGGEGFGPLEGRDAIVEFISTVTREQQDQRRHVVSNVRLTGERTAMAYLTLVVVADGMLTVKSSGVYRLEFAQEEARWRISELRLALDLPF